jgi:hypothetical protein
MIRTLLLSLFAAIALLGTSCSSFWNTSSPGVAFDGGVYRLGGSANLNFTDNEFNGTDTDTLGGSVDVGRFFTSNIELGLRGSYEATDNGTVETDASDLSLFGRWYTSSRAVSRPWIEVGGGMGSVDNGTVDVSGSIFFMALGLSHFLTQSVAAEIFARQSIGSFDDGIESDTLDLGIGFSFFL